MTNLREIAQTIVSHASLNKHGNIKDLISELDVLNLASFYLQKTENEKELFIPPVGKTDVHTEHCCIEHGCKYGEDDCPVYLGYSKQTYRCESCEEVDPVATIEEIESRRNEYRAVQN